MIVAPKDDTVLDVLKNLEVFIHEISETVYRLKSPDIKLHDVESISSITVPGEHGFLDQSVLSLPNQVNIIISPFLELEAKLRNLYGKTINEMKEDRINVIKDLQMRLEEINTYIKNASKLISPAKDEYFEQEKVFLSTKRDVDDKKLSEKKLLPAFKEYRKKQKVYLYFSRVLNSLTIQYSDTYKELNDTERSHTPKAFSNVINLILTPLLNSINEMASSFQKVELTDCSDQHFENDLKNYYNFNEVMFEEFTAPSFKRYNFQLKQKDVVPIFQEIFIDFYPRFVAIALEDVFSDESNKLAVKKGQRLLCFDDATNFWCLCRDYFSTKMGFVPTNKISIIGNGIAIDKKSLKFVPIFSMPDGAILESTLLEIEHPCGGREKVPACHLTMLC